MTKPIIGITASFEDQRKLVVTRHYSDWIIQEGGLPYIIPYTQNLDVLEHYVRTLDGLLLSGGGDIDPTLFDEEPHPQLGSITPERDEVEINLSCAMLEQNKPILAICRGCQILNVSAGGSMFQDLSTQYSTAPLLQHEQRAPFWHESHTIQIQPDSLLHKILLVDQCKTNSFHHQAIKDPAPFFSISAMTGDKVVEAIESTIHDYVIGVQWHPECMPLDHPLSTRLFHSFVDACKSKRRTLNSA
ncbi:gamma-glutamyl-gamma-aminobutyrate hydrolase family protein [Caldalkalibacillus mannanilyticus]|uniref:gamma-glutamyl-gamma-aminobutyrate hydrolase family protein n=1 Tax=Caldalkalibacillus mannanilyticus TaxID=1418 RepID=UPI00046A4B49|nr:gamma-glutamyl-gamma-aminobutyrate hydrolase family protein [Caldalkalibacillus mannanilyticus]